MNTNQHDSSPEATQDGAQADQQAAPDALSVDQAAQVLDRIASQGRIAAAETLPRAARPTIRKRDPETSRKAPKMPQGLWWADLDRRHFPKRGWLVQGLMKDHDVAMVYSPTGVGKTWFTLSLAVLMAGGGEMAGRFCCDTPRKVLLLDGEMAMDDIQERIRALAPGLKADPEQLAKNLLIFSRQDQGPDSQFVTLDTPEWQDGIIEAAKGFDCLIFDNFSTLSEVEDENSASQVRGVNDLLLKLKQMNKSAILVHHANKSKIPGDGGYRGSSNLAVVLNLIVRLEKDRQADLGSFEGARFSVVFEKTRAKLDQSPLALKLVEVPFEGEQKGGTVPVAWTIDEESGNTVDRFVRHVASGQYTTMKEIAEAMGVHFNTLTGIRQSAYAQGALTPLRYTEHIKRAKKARHAPLENDESDDEESEEVDLPF